MKIRLNLMHQQQNKINPQIPMMTTTMTMMIYHWSKAIRQRLMGKLPMVKVRWKILQKWMIVTRMVEVVIMGIIRRKLRQPLLHLGSTMRHGITKLPNHPNQLKMPKKDLLTIVPKNHPKKIPPPSRNDHQRNKSNPPQASLLVNLLLLPKETTPKRNGKANPLGQPSTVHRRISQ